MPPLPQNSGYATANIEQTVTIGASVIEAAAEVRDLGVLLGQTLNMTQHIAKVTLSSFYLLRRLRQIRRPVGQELVAQLVHSFVLSKIDYCNSIEVNRHAASMRSERSSNL